MNTVLQPDAAPQPAPLSAAKSRGVRSVFGAMARVILPAVLLVAMVLVARQAVAEWYFRRGSPDALRCAVQWDPWNPEYHAALAHALERSLEPVRLEEIAAHYERAVRLGPYRVESWAALAGVYEWGGEAEKARSGYERARNLFPQSPDINWKLGNFHIRAGRLGEGLAALRLAFAGDPRLRGAAFELAWRAGAGYERVLEEMLPPAAEFHLQFVDFLVEKNLLDEAEQVWARVVARGELFDPQRAFSYLDGLTRHQRVASLARAWRELAALSQGPFPPPSAANLVVNGGFESEILNGGLDWRVFPVEGAVVQVDAGAAFEGARALRVEFDGRHNVAYEHVFQYVPVDPGAAYRLTARLRARGVTTDSGPRLEVLDAYNASRLSLAGPPALASFDWTPLELSFRTPAATRLLAVRLARPASRKLDNRIAGAVWLDAVTLARVD